LEKIICLVGEYYLPGWRILFVCSLTTNPFGAGWMVGSGCVLPTANFNPTANPKLIKQAKP
jgi:hypothetical protein